MFAQGCGLVGAGILLTGLTMLLFRRPEPPRWTRPELVAMLVTVPLTAIIGLGLGYMLIGGYRLVHGAGELYELAAPFGVAFVVAGVWRLLGIRRRLQAYSAASPLPNPNFHAAVVPTLALATRRRLGHRSDRHNRPPERRPEPPFGRDAGSVHPTMLMRQAPGDRGRS